MWCQNIKLLLGKECELVNNGAVFTALLGCSVYELNVIVIEGIKITRHLKLYKVCDFFSLFLTCILLDQKIVTLRRFCVSI